MAATLREMRQVAQPLVDGDPRLAFVGRAIVLRPVGHWLHGFSLAPPGPNRQPDMHLVKRGDRLIPKPVSGKARFWPRTLLQPLYVPARRLQPGYGRPIYAPHDMGVWRVTTPDVSRIFCELAVDTIESTLNVDTPDKFGIWAEHASLHEFEESIAPAIILTHALAGRLATAIREAERNIAIWQGATDRRTTAPASPAQARRLRRLIKVFEAGQARTNRLLRTFEWITAGHLGVRRWWTWTPAVE
jgi:hypothetical protein